MKLSLEANELPPGSGRGKPVKPKVGCEWKERPIPAKDRPRSAIFP